MQAVAHLVTLPVESEIAQRLLPFVTMNPKRENPLVGFPELARTGHHSTAINVDAKAKGIGILQRQLLGGVLGHAVKGEGRLGREFLRHSGGGQSAHFLRDRPIGLVFDGQLQARKLPDGIDAAGT